MRHAECEHARFQRQRFREKCYRLLVGPPTAAYRTWFRYYTLCWIRNCELWNLNITKYSLRTLALQKSKHAIFSAQISSRRYHFRITATPRCRNFYRMVNKIPWKMEGIALVVLAHWKLLSIFQVRKFFRSTIEKDVASVTTVEHYNVWKCSARYVSSLIIYPACRQRPW